MHCQQFPDNVKTLRDQYFIQQTDTAGEFHGADMHGGGKGKGRVALVPRNKKDTILRLR